LQGLVFGGRAFKSVGYKASLIMMSSAFYFEKMVAMKIHFAGKQTHNFHIVTESPWPLFGAAAAFCITVGSVQKFHAFDLAIAGVSLLEWGLCLVCFVAFLWWRDVVREATFLGYHTKKVVRGLRFGMILFIVSEVMFFFSFFWAFFHASLSPSVVLGSVWPPIGINVLNPLHLPLLNTFILLSSGLAVTISHFCICCLSPKWQTGVVHAFRNNKWPLHWDTRFPHEFGDDRELISDDDVEVTNIGQFTLLVTILLAFEFTCCQAYEYYDALFYINDGIFGSTFYVATGFHGLHVIIGTIFLVVCLFRFFKEHLLVKHHVGFEMAIWYWHFVDVVWLVLYVFIYCWSAGFTW
jgi:cytochrome c oxidase subunit 3